MKFQTQYTAREDSDRVKGLTFRDQSLTQQQFKQECDINYILNQYLRTGVLTHVSSETPYYSDVSELGSYSAALDVVRRAETAFMELPAKLREELGNSPARFESWLAAPENRERAVELGFLSVPERVASNDTTANAPEPSLEKT